jgi:hypothetical protein
VHWELLAGEGAEAYWDVGGRHSTHGGKNLQTKTSKEFGYLHVWLIVKEYPRWAEGWGTSTTVAPSRRPRVAGADQESVIGVSEEATGFEDGGDMESNVGLQVQPTGSKAAKEAHKAAKTKDNTMYAQVAAQEVLGVAATAKAAIMAEHNLILLMRVGCLRPRRGNSLH